MKGCFVCCVGLSIVDKFEYELFFSLLGAMRVYMALHGTVVEDETLMVVLCYERIDGEGGIVQASWRFLVMRPIKEEVLGKS
mgnify:CR=1 FL=1